MWRACLDLQRIMEEMELRRAEIRGKRKRHEDIGESLRKAARAARTRANKAMES
jgi:hypothetical protein